MKPVDGSYCLGRPGCDNRIAFEFNKAGYRLSNPSKTIQAIHLHTVNIRSYTQDDRIVGDYLYIPTSVLEVNSLLIKQPGKVGDIIRVLPIAKWYAQKGFVVFWQCPKIYHHLFDYVDYVTPVESDGDYTKTIDLSFGIDTKAEVHQLWMNKRKTIDSFVTLKYEIANVPIELFNELDYNRDNAKEDELFDLVTKNVLGSYRLVHRLSDYGSPITVDDAMDVVLFEPIEGYSIFDWRKVIENADEIHCIDSSLVNFADTIKGLKSKLFYYITDKVPNKSDQTLLSQKWKMINCNRIKIEA